MIRINRMPRLRSVAPALAVAAPMPDAKILRLIEYEFFIVGLTVCTPWIVAFIFGPLHSFGFEGALSE